MRHRSRPDIEDPDPGLIILGVIQTFGALAQIASYFESHNQAEVVRRIRRPGTGQVSRASAKPRADKGEPSLADQAREAIQAGASAMGHLHTAVADPTVGGIPFSVGQRAYSRSLQLAEADVVDSVCRALSLSVSWRGAMGETDLEAQGKFLEPFNQAIARSYGSKCSDVVAQIEPTIWLIASAIRTMVGLVDQSVEQPPEPDGHERGLN